MRNMGWVVLLATALSTIADDTVKVDNSFYSRKAEGWFWYQEKPEETVTVNTADSSTPNPTLNSTQPALSAVWMRENLPKYKDAAWNNPTIENMQAFMYLQRYALDRAQAFAETAEMAVMGDWFLDETIRRPESSFAAQQVDQKAGESKKQLVKQLASKLGLFFFFRSDCQHSQLQVATLKMLQRYADFTIVPISLDGGQPGPSFLSEYKADNGHAARLGVKATPALFLVSENGEFSPLGYGAMSLQELERRLLIAARRKNWITPQQFDSTRQILNASNCLALPSSTFQGQLPISPSELINQLRSINQREKP